MKKNNLYALVATVIFSFPGIGFGDFVYESATGTTPSNSGVVVSSGQFFGSRFTVDELTRVTAIGGTFNNVFDDDETLFGAVVVLFDSLPQGSPFDGDELLGSTVFNPVNTGDSIADIDLLLEPGNYAVIFGSGLFGAVGSDSLPSNGTTTPEGEGSHFSFNASTGNWSISPSQGERLFVRGSVVPEPAMLPLFLAFTVSFAGGRRRKI